MFKSLAGLLGAVSVLALTVPAPAQAAIVSPSGFDPGAVQDVQYYHHYHRHWHRHWHHWHRGPVVVVRPY